jgi:hypothetical protein
MKYHKLTTTNIMLEKILNEDKTWDRTKATINKKVLQP